MSFRAFVTVCTTVVAVALIIAVAVAQESKMEHAAIATMVERGFTPMEARCATLTSMELKTNPACIAIAVRAGSEVKTDSDY